MKIKTSELEGVALDWAVAKSLGWHMIPVPRDCDGENGGYEVLAPQNIKPDEWVFPPKGRISPSYFIKRWSTDWSQGGSLFESHKVGMLEPRPTENHWTAWLSGHGGKMLDGPMPLIAACRAIVAAKLGDEVDVPDELL